MFASTFELFVDADGKTAFPIFSGDNMPTGETISYLCGRVGEKVYCYAFNPANETIPDVIPKLQEYINQETGGQ